MNAPCFLEEKVIHPVNFPDYIGSVFPSPDTSFRLACYIESNVNGVNPERRGISVLLAVSEIDTDPINSFDNLVQRINLTVDNDLIDRSAMLDVIKKGELRYINRPGNSVPQFIVVSWGPELGLGQHTAILTIERDIGQPLVFEWQFTIIR